MAYNYIAGETGEYTGTIEAVLTTAITSLQYIFYWESTGKKILDKTLLTGDLTQALADVTFPVVLTAGLVEDHKSGDVGLAIDVLYATGKVERVKGKFLNVISFTDE